MDVSDTLIRKWRKLFKYRDTNNDGIVTVSDFKRYAERFVKVYGERAIPALEIGPLIWYTFAGGSKQTAVSEQEFIDNWIYLYNNAIEIFREKIGKYCDLSFDAIDSNSDSFINLEEYTVYQNCFGVHNQDYIKHVFSQIAAPGKDTVRRQEFVDEIMDFVFEDRPEKIPELYDEYQAKNFKKVTPK